MDEASSLGVERYCGCWGTRSAHWLWGRSHHHHSAHWAHWAHGRSVAILYRLNRAEHLLRDTVATGPARIKPSFYVLEKIACGHETREMTASLVTLPRRYLVNLKHRQGGCSLPPYCRHDCSNCQCQVNATALVRMTDLFIVNAPLVDKKAPRRASAGATSIETTIATTFFWWCVHYYRFRVHLQHSHQARTMPTPRMARGIIALSIEGRVQTPTLTLS